MRASATATFLVLLLTGATLSGCVSPGDTIDAASLADASGRFPDATFDTTRAWSMPLKPGVYDKLPGVNVFVDSFDGTPISMGLHFPAIDGCDWNATGEAPLADACRLPVVMDAGPYWAGHVDSEGFRPPLVDWLVPRGYVVAYMSIRGTGESGGCMELFSEQEQKDVSEMVTWLATQPWSSGNVGMMGRSYDGTTPLMAAAMGNPHLKTIVPISSVADLGDLMFKNGTSELRGSIFHSVVYWGNYGLGAGDGGAGPGGHRFDHTSEQACEDAAMGAVEGPKAAATGDTAGAYWTERELASKVVQNYNGSIWIVHGMEDWNVNPSQVVPWFQDLQNAGLKTKMWLGVWGHAYPDRSDEHRNVRWDWAEWTVRWFDSELKGLDVDTGPAVEVEDSQFVWRAEATYPPRDIMWQDMMFEGGNVIVAPNQPASSTSAPLETAVRIAGLTRLPLVVTPTSAAPTHLFAELFDVYPDGVTTRLGWGAINLHYAAGGNTDPQPPVPGMPLTALLEFEPMDALIAQGHRLRLNLHMDGVEDILPGPASAPATIDMAASPLQLPTIERAGFLASYQAKTLGGESE